MLLMFVDLWVPYILIRLCKIIIHIRVEAFLREALTSNICDAHKVRI